MISFFISLILVLVICFLIGGIPFGYLIGKLHHLDIRELGSKNIGATNVTRVVGKWWGKLCFLCDFLKGFLPVFITLYLVRNGVLTDGHGLLSSAAALGTVGGHIWPVYLKFKGGKGIATAAGAFMAIHWIAVLAALIVWCIVFLTSRYVSLASIIAAVVLPVAALLLRYFSIPPFIPNPALVLIVLIAVLAIWKHRSNIQRLLNGTESRFVKGERK